MYEKSIISITKKKIKNILVVYYLFQNTNPSKKIATNDNLEIPLPGSYKVDLTHLPF